MNQVCLIGNIGNDAEVRYTSDQTPVANFSIALSERWRDKISGEQQEKTTWVRIVYWGNGAKALEPYLKKGKKISVCGSLQENKWEDRDGKKRTTMEVKAHRVDLLGSRSDQREDAQPERSQPAPTPELTMDDVPFAWLLPFLIPITAAGFTLV